MKKRMLSILLSLVIVIGLMPVNVLADSTGTGEHTHCVCGKSDCGDESHGGEMTWIGVSSLYEIQEPGNYYLKQSVTITERWHLFNDSNINLCLNGYSIRCRNSVQGDTMYTTILNHGNLTITDCKTTGTIEYYNPNHPGVTIHNRAGTFNLWNGTISGNDSGAGVFNGENFNMYGGRIRNNTNPNTYSGAGVINGGEFNMYGGEITGNTATGKGGSGGVFNRGSNTFNMYGGSITGNTGVGAGGLYNLGTVNFSGTPIINGNTVDGVENNVFLRNDGKTVAVAEGGMSAGASVGITGTIGETVITGTTSSTGFFCDNSNYDLVSDGNGGLKLSVHDNHRICGDSDCTDTEHGDELTFKGISDLSEINKDGNYYLKKDVSLDDMWVCLYNVNLCLNGKSVVSGVNKATIGVNYDKSLTITDCQETVGKITHKEGLAGSGIENYAGSTLNLWNGSISENTDGSGVYNKEGTFNMYGGSISGNITGADGGGVLNSEGGTFNMYGGEISGNSASSNDGGGVKNSSGRFNMYGGEISGNTAYRFGGGVNNHSNGTISISGAPIISGNNKGGKIAADGTITGGKTENIYLIGTKTVNVTGEIADGASIGISGTLGNTVVSGTSDTKGFFSDETNYFLKDDDNGGLKLVRDAKVSGKLLVEADGDELTDGKKTYDGNAVVFADPMVKISGNNVENAIYTYVWQKKGDDGTYATLAELTDSTGPVDAGDYQVTVTATKNNEELASATWSFTVEKAMLTVTFDVQDKVYDGTTDATIKIKDVVGLIGNDELDISTQNEKFANANVGTDIAVTANLIITGEAAKNYTVPDKLEGKANITPKQLAVNVTAQDKIYDGTTAATVNAELDKSGVIGSDEVVLVTSGVTATFDTKNFGTNKTVTISGDYELSGAAAGNYTLNQPENLTANISKKELTIENLAVADKFYDGTDKAAISGTPTLGGVAENDEVTLVNATPSFTGVATGKNIAVSFTEFTLDGSDAGNYTLIQPTGITANINPYIADKSEYFVNSNDWQNTDFVVTAKDGWQLSYSNTADGEWVDTLTASQETDNGEMSFYVKNKESGVISEVITESYKIDKTVPVGEIRIDERNAWQEFLNTISFNLFFKDKQTVTVTANDSASGIKTIEYLLTADDLSIDQLANKTFTAYEKAFGIEPDTKCIVYAKLTDIAGNVTYLRSDGIVLDATAPVINGADDGKTYCSSVTLTVTDEYLDVVTLNGDPVTLTDGKLTINPANGEQTVIATDKAGNSTTVKLTVNNGHTWGEWTSNGNNTHTRTCEFDAAHTDTADCHGGTATCQVKAVCDDCHETYGYFGAHDWDTTAWGYITADGHAYTCKTDGCTEHSALIEHIKDRDAATEEDPVKCTKCDYVIAEALGHICANHLEPVEAKAATCTEAGNKAYYKCSCGKLYEDAAANTEITDHDSVIKNALGHDWAAATCTAPKTCKRDGCGATDGDPLGHKYSTEWSKDETNHWHACQNAGCTDKADLAKHIPGEAATETTDQTCTECGYVIAKKLGHICANHLEPVEAKAATCTETGNTAYYKCSCGKLYEDAAANTEITDPDSVIKNALGHDWAPATCTAPKTCKRDGCGATDGDPLGHNYSTEWSKDETNHWHACQNAGCTDKADLAQHIPGEAATETTDQTCTECGYVIAKKLGHICANHLTLVKAKEATCTKKGNTAYYKCSCGKLYEDEGASIEITKEQTVIAALGHDYEWKIDKEATATEKGSKHQECKVCHNKKAAVEIPATGKTDSKDPKTDGTSPKTGDTNMIWLWIALMFVFGAGALGITGYSKKKTGSADK